MSDLKILEKLDTLKNYADEHIDAWPKWKRDVIANKVECLMRIMESTGRRAQDTE